MLKFQQKKKKVGEKFAYFKKKQYLCIVIKKQSNLELTTERITRSLRICIQSRALSETTFLGIVA